MRSVCIVLHTLSSMLTRPSTACIHGCAATPGAFVRFVLYRPAFIPARLQISSGCLLVNLLFAVQLPFINMGLIMGDAWLLIRELAENMYSPSACYVARLAIHTGDHIYSPYKTLYNCVYI